MFILKSSTFPCPWQNATAFLNNMGVWYKDFYKIQIIVCWWNRFKNLEKTKATFEQRKEGRWLFPQYEWEIRIISPEMSSSKISFVFMYNMVNHMKD